MGKWKFGPLMGWDNIRRHPTPFVWDTPVSWTCVQHFGISVRLSGRRSSLSINWPNWTFYPRWRVEKYGIGKTINLWFRGWSLYVSHYSTPWSAAWWRGRALFIGVENGKWQVLPDAERRAYKNQGVSYCEYAMMDEGDGQHDAFRELCGLLRDQGCEYFVVQTYWASHYPIPLKSPESRN